MAVAQSLTQILKEVNSGENEESWRKLLLFTYAVLPVPQKSDQVKNLTTWVKSRTSAWEENFATPQPLPPRPPNKKPPGNDTSKKIEAKLADGDVRGAIRLACSEDTIAPNDEGTLSALLIKHPPHPQPTDFPQAPEDTLTLPVVALEAGKAISTFPPGSAREDWTDYDLRS